MEWKANKVYPISLYKHKGYLAVNDKNAGLFGYRDQGEYKGSKYDKARLYEVYQPMTSPKLRFARHRLGSYDLSRKTSFSNVGIQPSLIPLAIEILNKIHKEITGETALPMLSNGTTSEKQATKKREASKPSPQELAKRIGI